MTASRSAGYPLMAGVVPVAIAGGGYKGITRELDEIVLDAAALLTQAYGKDVEIRFNSDQESGGAWLRTSDGRNADVGIGASVVTARARDAWERWARLCEAEAAGAGDLTSEQRQGARLLAADWRGRLADSPEGQLTVYAHVRAAAVAPGLRAALAGLPGWQEMNDDRSYHHGPAGSAREALTRCLQFAPATPLLAAGQVIEDEGPLLLPESLREAGICFRARAWPGLGCGLVLDDELLPGVPPPGCAACSHGLGGNAMGEPSPACIRFTGLSAHQPAQGRPGPSR